VTLKVAEPRVSRQTIEPGSAKRAARGQRRRGPIVVSNYLYLLPAVALVGGIIYYSIGYTVWLSFFDWDGISPDKVAVGFGNYIQAFTDPIFWKSLGNMGLFVSTVIIQLVLGLGIAMLMHSNILGKAVYKVIVFIPVVLAPAIMAPIYRQILAPDGYFNDTLRSVGLGSLAHPWLADPHTALWALVAINVWQWTGLSFLLYYAALGQVDASLIEAARLDGVGTWKLLRHILIPQVNSTTLTLLILGVIGVLKTFDLPYLVTSGGPANSTQFLSTYIFLEGLTNLHAGYGAALSILLLLLSLIFTAYQIARYRRTTE
jgi:raffinose/stachyose/melibiose transport system permease protein